MPGSASDIPPSEELLAASDHAELGWSVLPGAVWDEGRFLVVGGGLGVVSVYESLVDPS
ncbi:hypothetical protein BN6_43680 [Saccharothrix espanaensis DSM 44229]|uniref:Uncharacterized protein n=1 Tax=Saccharothrix espanaensis (strain ATCC 51144 / DSM 44229 / JCM 9112 / NBRC 15066 / NRRL 15764) TaxID=1179773 RepID=K0JUY1_SACES|nr:hypothetical protein BN6_43680 [Saccharothrix espanaensis DSM 44229]